MNNYYYKLLFITTDSVGKTTYHVTRRAYSCLEDSYTYYYTSDSSDEINDNKIKDTRPDKERTRMCVLMNIRSTLDMKRVMREVKPFGYEVSWWGERISSNQLAFHAETTVMLTNSQYYYWMKKHPVTVILRY